MSGGQSYIALEDELATSSREEEITKLKSKHGLLVIRQEKRTDEYDAI